MRGHFSAAWVTVCRRGPSVRRSLRSRPGSRTCDTSAGSQLSSFPRAFVPYDTNCSDGGLERLETTFAGTLNNADEPSTR